MIFKIFFVYNRKTKKLPEIRKYDKLILNELYKALENEFFIGNKIEYKRKLFLQFKSCDTNNNRELDELEFEECLDKYIYHFEYLIPDFSYLSAIKERQLKRQGIVTRRDYIRRLFDILVPKRTKMSFSLFVLLIYYNNAFKNCGNIDFNIYKEKFECLIKEMTLPNELNVSEQIDLAKLYDFSLKYSANEGYRYLDILTFLFIEDSIRVFQLSYNKYSLKLRKNDLINALNNDILPIRYNFEVIDEMFELVKGTSDYLDMYTFIFYDCSLKVYKSYITGYLDKLDVNEYNTSFRSIYFPRKHLDLTKKYEIAIFNDYKSTTQDERVSIPKLFPIIKNNSNYVENKKETENETMNQSTNENLEKLEEQKERELKKYDSLYEETFDDNIKEDWTMEYKYKNISSGMLAFRYLTFNKKDKFLSFYEYALIIRFYYHFSSIDIQNYGYVQVKSIKNYFKNNKDEFFMDKMILDGIKRLSLLDKYDRLSAFHTFAYLESDYLISKYQQAQTETITTIKPLNMRDLISVMNLPFDGLERYQECRVNNENNYNWNCVVPIAFKYGIYQIMNDLRNHELSNFNNSLNIYSDVEYLI